jgi:hypothetical protein
MFCIILEMMNQLPQENMEVSSVGFTVVVEPADFGFIV